MATAEKPRPQMPIPSRSFSRYEPPKVQSPTRARASTVTTELLSPVQEPLALKTPPHDIYENEEAKEDSTPVQQAIETPASPRDLPEGFDDLPIELVSLTDRFVLLLDHFLKLTSSTSIGSSAP